MYNAGVKQIKKIKKHLRVRPCSLRRKKNAQKTL